MNNIEKDLDIEELALSEEKMQILKDLGVNCDSASMCLYYIYGKRLLIPKNMIDLIGYDNIIKTFTASDMLKLMPTELGWNHLMIYFKNENYYCCSYLTERASSSIYESSGYSYLINAVYDTFLQLAKDNRILGQKKRKSIKYKLEKMNWEYIHSATNNEGDSIVMVYNEDTKKPFSIISSEVHSVDNIGSFSIYNVDKNKEKYLFDENTGIFYTINRDIQKYENNK